MTYSIKISPDGVTVTADLTTAADIAKIMRALTVVTPLIGGSGRPEEITREPRQAKAVRAEKALKEIAAERGGEAGLDARLAAAMDEEERAPLVKAEPAPRPPVRPLPDDDDEPPPRVGRGHAVPADRDEKLRDLWSRDDLSLNQIADKLGLHFTTVSQRAKQLGLPSRKGKKRPPAEPAVNRPGNGAFDRSRAASITAALMGDPGHGPSLTAERAGMQRDGGGAT